MSKAKFYIYRNLNRGNLFSVKHKGKVIDRLDNFIASDCRMQVSDAGRKRVITNQKRNVHAFIVTDSYMKLHNVSSMATDRLNQIKYNPYRTNYFTINNNRIDYATMIWFTDGKAYLLEE